MVRKVLLAAIAISILLVTSCLTPDGTPSQSAPQTQGAAEARGGDSDSGESHEAAPPDAPSQEPEIADDADEPVAATTDRQTEKTLEDVPPSGEPDIVVSASEEASTSIEGAPTSRAAKVRTDADRLRSTGIIGSREPTPPRTYRPAPGPDSPRPAEDRSVLSDESLSGRPMTYSLADPAVADPAVADPAVVDPAVVETSRVAPEEERWREVASRLASADLPTRMGQLLMVQLRTGSDGRPIQHMTPEVRRLLDTVRPGGVILFAENIATAEQTAAFIRELQAASEIPLFVSVDEEGGFVSRLNRGASIGATRVPSAEKIGRTGDPEYARLVGEVVGTELKALGINMNMAPVADVNTNPDRGIIAKHERSFGSDPYLVGGMVSAMVEGLQSAGVSAVLKHFPGHGDTEQDTHHGAVVSESSLQRLREIEFLPFRQGIDSGADAVMTAHIAYPKITGDLMPATFSETLLMDVLRGELGFGGIVISDALEMGAVASSRLPTDPVVAAVAAGVDLVLSPRDPLIAHSALVNAVENGTLDPDRARGAVENILRAKAKRGLFDTVDTAPLPADVLGNADHIRIIREILDSATMSTEGETE